MLGAPESEYSRYLATEALRLLCDLHQHFIALLACRTKFAHLQYLRKNEFEEDTEENVVVFLVDAHELATPDQDAKDVLAKAASAATTEIEAKKACSGTKF